MHIRFIIQARLKSTRLQGKVLAPLGDRPLIQHILDRLHTFLNPNVSLKVALPFGEEKLAEYLESVKADYIYSSPENVLQRYCKASEDLHEDDYIVRLTGDNPFVDQDCLIEMLSNLPQYNLPDFAYPYKLPLGMGFEIIKTKALRDQLNYNLLPHHEEHVTTFIKENPEAYSIYKADFFSDMPDIRLTIDYESDLLQAIKTFEYFSKQKNVFFNSTDVYNLYKEIPSFFNLNEDNIQRPPTSYEPRNS
jgi:spore coat polysaccharide biosynthesis protein SpsF